MAEPTIYTVGGTVQANERGLYIQRQADAELLVLCRAATFAYVLTPRQLGKSSLMIRTAEQLIEEGVQCVIIDISGELGVNLTAEEWYKGLLTIIADQLMLTTNLEQWWQTHHHLGITQRLTKFFAEVLLTEIKDCVVIFVDEIDTTLSLDFTDDFYATIRYFHVARATNPEFRRLSFVLIGVATPGDLIRDPKRTPFNIGQRVDLTDFTFEEAQPLAEGLELPIETGQNVLRWVLKWTGGHPYLSQRLCRILADRHQADWSEAEVDRVVGSTFLGNASEQDNNLQFVRDMLTKRAPDIMSVLTVYQQVWRVDVAPRRHRHPVIDEEQSLVKSHLKLSGVVKREGKTLKIRNAIYQKVFNNTWIGSHLPVNWAKRLQRAAVVLIGLILVSSVPLAGFGWQKALEAEKQKAIAEQKAKEAEQQSKNAEEQRLIAEQQRKKAEASQKLAQKRQQEAEVAQQAEAKQRRIADQLRGKAETSRSLAEQRRQQAETAQKAEAEQRQLAVDARKTAEQRRQQAETAQTAEAQQRQIAEGQREEANKAKLVQTLAGQALAFRDVFPQRSLLFAVESLKTGKDILRRTEAGALLRRLLGEIGGTPLIGHEKPVVAVAFSPKGNWLATGSKDGTVRLWDKLNPDKPAIVFQGSIGEVKAIAISPDGKWLGAIANDTRILLWDISTPNFNAAPKILRGHSKPINALSFSPDGKWLATAGQDAIVGLWDMTNKVPGSQMIPLRGYKSEVEQVVFSRSGRWLATSEANSITGEGVDIDVRLWNVTAISSSATPIILKTQKYTENHIQGFAFSPDEKRLAAAISSSAQVWDLTSKNLATTPATIIGTNAGYFNSIAFSPDSRWLATVSNDLKLWDMRSLDSSQPKSPNCETDTYYSVCRLILRGHSAAIVKVNFSPDGKWLATASQDGTARLWNITDLLISPIVLQGHEGWVNTLTFDADGQWLATASEDTQARLWKVPNVLNDPIVLSGIHSVRAVAISPDRKWIASNSNDNIIRLWNTTDLMRPPILLTGHKYVISNLAFSPNGKWLASASHDGTARLWDMTSAHPNLNSRALRGHTEWIDRIAISPDSHWLATGSWDTTIRLWDLTATDPAANPRILRGHRSAIRSLAFSHDGKRLVSGSGDNRHSVDDVFALVWDMTVPDPSAHPIVLKGQEDIISDVDISPNNRWVATAGWDGKAILWDITARNPSASAKIIPFNSRVSQVAFSPDGRWLAAGSWDQKVQLQDMNNLAKKPDLLTGHRGGVFGLKFSPDSQWLASSSDDHTVRLWNPKDITAAPVVLRGHDSVVSPLAFSTDSRWLVSGSDSDVRLWRVHISNDDLITIACRTAGRNLTPKEWQEAFGKEPYHQTCPNLPAKEIQSSGVSTANSFGGLIWRKFQEAIAP